MLESTDNLSVLCELKCTDYVLLININNTELMRIKEIGWSLHVESARQYTREIKAELLLSVQDFPIWNNKGSLSHSSSESDHELPVQCCPGKRETHHWENWDKCFPQRKCWCQAPGRSWVLSFQEAAACSCAHPDGYMENKLSFKQNQSLRD